MLMDNATLNPQLKADAASLNVFCQVISQSASQLANMNETTSPEYMSMVNLMKHNLPALKTIIEKLEADLG